MILDYSEYIKRAGSHGVVNFKSSDYNVDLFNEDSICPFCKRKIGRIVYQKQKSDTPEWLFGTFNQMEYVVQCPDCGWWEYRYKNQSDAILDRIRASDLKIVTSVLKKYEDSSKTVPIQMLNKYIFDHPDKIYGISDKKMEELVQSVFSNYYKCHVELVGKSHDGGKDLILVDSNTPSFVQVKRRMSPTKVEAVLGIRELLGATILSDNAKSCIFVTTADHFSKPAQTAAQKAVEKHLVEKFELIDCKSFLNMMTLTRDLVVDIWKSLLTL